MEFSCIQLRAISQWVPKLLFFTMNSGFWNYCHIFQGQWVKQTQIQTDLVKSSRFDAISFVYFLHPLPTTPSLLVFLQVDHFLNHCLLSHCEHQESSVFKISAGPRTLASKTWVGPASFHSLPYINFVKIVLQSGKFQFLFWRLSYTWFENFFA